MATFTVTFKTDNAAFNEGSIGEEVAYVLRRVAEHRSLKGQYPLERGVSETGRVLDSNGTTVGNWEYIADGGDE